jgi:hypothetical protein
MRARRASWDTYISYAIWDLSPAGAEQKRERARESAHELNNAVTKLTKRSELGAELKRERARESAHELNNAVTKLTKRSELKHQKEHSLRP